MKKNYLLAALLLIFAIFTGCFNDKDDNNNSNNNELPVLTTQEKQQGYKLDTNENVTFVLTEDLFKSQLTTGAAITSINVAGSFNGWTKNAASWVMTKTADSIWTLSKTKEEVLIPGNSGHPEFKFVIFTTEPDATTKENWMQPPTGLAAGYSFLQKPNDRNTLVIFGNDSLTDIIADENQAMTIKTSESDFATVEQMTNFRNVKTGNIGTAVLFRSYHPFIPSRTTDTTLKDIEALKQSKLEGLMAANGIKSIINLSENMPGTSGTQLLKDADGKYYFIYKSVTYYANPTYQTALESGNVLNHETGYNTVYYGSTTDDYAKLMKDVCDFVKTHDAPFMVHCRLGTDRTGTVTAFLEALMGATWGEIAAEYNKSNEQAFREFRDAKILKYSFEKLLGKKINDTDKLDTDIINYLKTNTNIKYSDDDITKIREKLAAKN